MAIQSHRDQPGSSIIWRMESYINRRVWNTISDRMDRIVDLLPSNEGRTSLTSSLTRALKFDVGCDFVETTDAIERELLSFHGREFVAEILRARKLYSEERDVDFDEEPNEGTLERLGLIHDCPVFPGLDTYVRAVAGSSISAAKKLLMNSPDQNIAINWYGGRHHCHKNRAAGFCYVNDGVMAINVLRRKFRKVFYLDLDLHHGDGVESAFEYSHSVLTCSIHRYDLGFYPGTGGLTSNNATKINIPTLQGLSDTTLEQIMMELVFPAITNFEPDAIVVQLGCDGLATDPHKEWNLTIKGMGNIVNKLLHEVEPRPCLFLGGGGYNHTEAAKFWTYMTSIILALDSGRQISEIPDHDKLDAYEADGFLFWTPQNTEGRKVVDRNTDAYLDKIKAVLKTHGHMS